MSYKQTEAHDWLGEAAESYIAYQMAHAGFEVFGSSKWGADLAVHDAKSGRWWRVEVRSTDRDKRPGKKSKEKLRKAELLVEVNLKKNVFDTRIHKLVEGEKVARIDNPTFEVLKKFLLE